MDLDYFRLYQSATQFMTGDGILDAEKAWLAHIESCTSDTSHDLEPM
jgi:hypothetical protein